MRHIKKIEITTETVLNACVSNLTNEEVKNELIENIGTFEKHDEIFEQKTINFELHTIIQDIQINNIANASVLKKLYSDKFSKKGHIARELYDEILFSAPNEKCPYCNHRIADTIDHFLPKANFPIYSISPVNLLPACTQCNKGKTNSIPTNSGEQTLHPYFDNIEEFNWLECKIENLPKIVFKFKPKEIFEEGNINNERISNHFIFYNLNDLYKSNASSEFANIKRQITKIFNNKGAEELKEFLLEAYLSRKESDINSWQTAFYKALYESDEFVNGGFI